MTGIQTRAAGAEVLAVDHPNRTITLVAVPYDEYANVPYRGEVWREVFRPGAFAGLDRIDPTTVRVSRGHNRDDMTGVVDVVGKCIRLDTRSSVGLIAQVRVARTPLGDETLQLAAENLLSASVGFLAAPEWVQVDRGTRTRTVVRAELDHIALVMTPAYSGAAVLAVRAAPHHRIPTDHVMAWAWHRTDPIMRWARNRVGR